MNRSIVRLAFVPALLAAAFGGTAEAAAQDDPAGRLSPVGLARTHIGDSYVKVTYGRPYIRDRVIFGPAAEGDGGPLVPFDRIWRTGANEATEITLTGPLMVAGRRLEAGTYAVFTVPGADRWTVYFARDLGLDGTGIFDAATQTFTNVFEPGRAVLTVEAAARGMESAVDPFTIAFRPADGGADMLLRWERTEVVLPLRRP